jgi:Flp pilus assembly protein TadG
VSTPSPRFRRRRNDSGASAVEFALVVPLLILLLIGTITAGMTYSDHLSITNGAREAARYGAAADATNPATWAASVQSRVQQVYFNAAGQTPTDDQVCVKLVSQSGTVVASDSGTSCGTEPALPANMETGSCAVLVWMTKPGSIRLVVFPDLHPTLHAESVAYYGRTVDTKCTAK